MTRDKVRVGLVGVGNCASSFVQGLSYYRGAECDAEIPGLLMQLNAAMADEIDLLESLPDLFPIPRPTAYRPAS